VEAENPCACATVNVKCVEIAIALYVSVIKSGCNQRAKRIQTSELDPVIIVACTRHSINSRH
jgi:hypothetical protein